MSKAFYKLEDIADFTNINNFFALAAAPDQYTELTQPTLNIWTEADFEEYFNRYSERSIYISETQDAWTEFKGLFSRWVARNGHFIADKLYVLAKNYNPIENYNRLEKNSGDDTVTDTPTNWKLTKNEEPDNWKVTVEDTPTNWIKRTSGDVGTGISDATQDAVIPFNGSDYANVSRSQTGTDINEEQKGSYKKETSESGKKVFTEEQTGTMQHKTDYNHTITVSGNIGVLSTQDMVKQTLELYKGDFVGEWLRSFFDSCCYLV